MKTSLSELPISLKVKNEDYQLAYQTELLCSEDTINDNLKTQPSYFVWYAVLQELAEDELSEAKLVLEMTEAQLDSEYREKLAEEKKVTETLLSNRIRMDERYQAAVMAMNEARRNVGVLRAIRDAFYHRKDMLLALASNMRAQLDTTLILRNNRPEEKI